MFSETAIAPGKIAGASVDSADCARSAQPSLPGIPAPHRLNDRSPDSGAVKAKTLAAMVANYLWLTGLPHLNRKQLQRVTAASSQLAQAHADAPNLVPLAIAMLLWQDFDIEHDLVAQVRRLLLNAGVSKATWRLVANGSETFFYAPWHLDAGKPGRIALLWCSILSNLHVDREPAHAMVEALFGKGSNIRRRAHRITRTPWTEADRPMLQQAFQEAKQHPTPQRLKRFIDRELHPVCDWWLGTHPTLDHNQKAAGWAWMLKKAHDWRRECNMRQNRRPKQAFRVPLETYVERGFSAYALKTSIELAVEGTAMRNCVDTYAPDCASGRCSMYSIRDSATGRRAASTLLVWAPMQRRWVVSQTKGFANRQATREIHEFAEDLANACTQKMECTMKDPLVQLKRAIPKAIAARIRKTALNVFAQRKVLLTNPKAGRRFIAYAVVSPIIFQYEISARHDEPESILLREALEFSTSELGAISYGLEMVAFRGQTELQQLESALSLWWRLRQTMPGDCHVSVSMTSICPLEHLGPIDDLENSRGTRELHDALTCGLRFWAIDLTEF